MNPLGRASELLHKAQSSSNHSSTTGCLFLPDWYSISRIQEFLVACCSLSKTLRMPMDVPAGRNQDTTQGRFFHLWRSIGGAAGAVERPHDGSTSILLRETEKPEAGCLILWAHLFNHKAYCAGTFRMVSLSFLVVGRWTWTTVGRWPSERVTRESRDRMEAPWCDWAKHRSNIYIPRNVYLIFFDPWHTSKCVFVEYWCGTWFLTRKPQLGYSFWEIKYNALNNL